ncbi:MAG: hypothetical protein MUO78_04100, partial [candidate division Zixibacteria bacterium]|nr:hypothetical protein [candidate division Zixibacteria bacterium]
MSQNFYESIDNLTLLENNLYHLEFELSKENRSYFRVARESHQALHRAMVEALRRSANLAITGRHQRKDRSVKYQKGNEPFKEIHKTKVDGCKIAWRYSGPQLCEPPKIDYKRFEIPPSDNYLISFYDLSAMVQTECFMERYVFSKPIKITDKEMKSLEWLHEDIRNEYEHFIPKSYYVLKRDLINVSILCIEKSNELIYGSENT